MMATIRPVSDYMPYNMMLIPTNENVVGSPNISRSRSPLMSFVSTPSESFDEVFWSSSPVATPYGSYDETWDLQRIRTYSNEGLDPSQVRTSNSEHREPSQIRTSNGNNRKISQVSTPSSDHYDSVIESCGASTVAIDNKIEQAMDLVKSHLMFAVREEVEVLKERIKELCEQNKQLEIENQLLKRDATPETLATLNNTKQQTPPS